MRYFPKTGTGAAGTRKRQRFGIGAKTIWAGSTKGDTAGTNSMTGKNRMELGMHEFADWDRPVGIMQFFNALPEEHYPAFLSAHGGYSTYYDPVQPYAKIRLVGPNMTELHDPIELSMGRRYATVELFEYPEGASQADGVPYDAAKVGVLRNTSQTGESNSSAAVTYWANNSTGPFIVHQADNHFFYTSPANGTIEQRLTVWGAANQVDVAGTLTKVSGTFDIEHPTVEGKRLRHSFLEGPQADLIYRGTSTLGSTPTLIDLDAEFNMTSGTWEALNCSPWSMVASSGHTVEWSFSGAELTITGPEGAVCNWMVIGERHDPAMKSEGCQVADEHGHIIVEYVPEPKLDPLPDLPEED